MPKFGKLNRILKPAISEMLKNPSLISSVLSGDFDKMYCQYWRKKLSESEKFHELVFNNDEKDLIKKISELNHEILNDKNATIEAYYIPLYFLVRIIKPEIIVETGVHRGVSSLFMLQAMHENNKGILYSIDLPQAEYEHERGVNPRDTTKSVLPTEKIGVCITKNLRKRWNLILGDSRKELPKLLEDLSTIDIFLHDSKHTRDHMRWEYETAWPHIKNSGLLVSDDTNWSRGTFEEFAKNNNSQNIQLRRDGRSEELFGIILKNTSKNS